MATSASVVVVAAVAQVEQWRTVRTVRVLGAKVGRVDRAWERDGVVGDDVDAERLLGGGQHGWQQRRIWFWNSK